MNWNSFKKKIIQLFGSILMEKDVAGVWHLSLGRVSFWLAFVPALYIWVESGGDLEKDISPNHLTMLLTLAGYNFSKKAISVVNQVWGKNDGPG